MNELITKKITLLNFAFALVATVSAQDYLTGKLTDSVHREHKIFYDRTQFAIGISVYQTVYKVMDPDKMPLYTITLTHDGFKGIVYMACKENSNDPQGKTITYNKKSSGLIFSDLGATDTVFSALENYEYLFSFTDADRDYPVLHEMEIEGGQQVQLDPLTRLRLKKNTEIIRGLGLLAEQTLSLAPAQHDLFLAHLLEMRDSLYARSASYYENITELRGKIGEDVQHYFDEKKVTDAETRYAGEMKSGKPQGRGIQVENGSIYDGVFEKGTLNKGTAALRVNSAEYYGEYSSGDKNGIGWLKYTNGDFWLGVFANGNLSDGIALLKGTTGEVYFGDYKNNRKNGYGELRNPRGDRYYGDFQDDRLITGYAKEVDQFGYATYSRIEKGVKKSIDQQEAGEFFEATLYAKK